MSTKCASCSKDTGGAKFCPACGALQPNAAPSPISPSGGSSAHKGGILGRMSSQQATFKVRSRCVQMISTQLFLFGRVRHPLVLLPQRPPQGLRPWLKAPAQEAEAAREWAIRRCVSRFVGDANCANRFPKGTSTTVIGQYGAGIGEKVACSKCEGFLCGIDLIFLIVGSYQAASRRISSFVPNAESCKRLLPDQARSEAFCRLAPSKKNN